MTNKIELERMTLEYTNVSPFRLAAVGQAERARYIKDELDGIEPTPPTYTVTMGGGVLPNGTKLPDWEQVSDYTAEYIAQLQDEHDLLIEQPPTPQAQSRLVELRAILAAWEDYLTRLRGLGNAVRYERWKVGLWHAFKSNMPDNDNWIKEQKADGIDTSEIPTDERERFRYWLRTEAVSTQQEYNLLVFTVDQDERMIGVTQARIAAREMFQRPLGQ